MDGQKITKRFGGSSMKTEPLYALEACNFVWISAESISQMSGKIGSWWWEDYTWTEEGKQSQHKLKYPEGNLKIGPFVMWDQW